MWLSAFVRGMRLQMYFCDSYCLSPEAGCCQSTQDNMQAMHCTQGVDAKQRTIFHLSALAWILGPQGFAKSRWFNLQKPQGQDPLRWCNTVQLHLTAHKTIQHT